MAGPEVTVGERERGSRRHRPAPVKAPLMTNIPSTTDLGTAETVGWLVSLKACKSVRMKLPPSMRSVPSTRPMCWSVSALHKMVSASAGGDHIE